jgi:hypothetical protein
MRGATSKGFPRLHYDPDQRDRQTVAELETGEGNARIGLGPGSRKWSFLKKPSYGRNPK